MAPLVAGLSRDPWGDEALHGRSRWKPVLTGLGILGVVLFCAFDLYAVIYGFGPPDNWRNPPLYPGGHDVKVQDFGPQGRPQLDSGTPLFVIKIITFTSTDQPEQALAYYRDVFNEARWHNARARVDVTDPQQFRLLWHGGGLRAPTDYLIFVTITPS